MLAWDLRADNYKMLFFQTRLVGERLEYRLHRLPPLAMVAFE
jgi:hypothetical protein